MWRSFQQLTHSVILSSFCMEVRKKISSFRYALPAVRTVSKTSGARWAGLPPGAIPWKYRRVKSSGWSWTANPKSQILSTPSSETKMLSIFMSRWTMPFWARNCSASASWRHQLRNISSCVKQQTNKIRYKNTWPLWGNCEANISVTCREGKKTSHWPSQIANDDTLLSK